MTTTTTATERPSWGTIQSHAGPIERWPGSDELVRTARHIAKEVAGPCATEVDARARFPHEAVDALRTERMLGAAVPSEHGGAGVSLATLGSICEGLAEQCASTGMIYAMHTIQVACIARHHGGSPFFARYLAELASGRTLIASVTSEVGVGGDLRRSVAAVETEADRFSLQKDAPTISYGLQADDLLLTARSSPRASANDQVLVLARSKDYTLENSGSWDTLGMRGTCSQGALVTAHGSEEQILPVPFGVIAAQTMTPVSHALWASCWLGIATAAEARARAFVQRQARATPGTLPPAATRLAELSGVVQLMRTTVRDYARQCDALMRTPSGSDELSSLPFALRTNNVKVSSSRLAVDIVGRALEICGIVAYKNDSEFALGRHLRDAVSAPLMIANDRVYATNASILMVLKEDGDKNGHAT